MAGESITAEESSFIPGRIAERLTLGTGLILLATGLFFYLKAFEDALVDDVFINLQYARTLLESGSWGWFPGQVGNAATSPANIVILAVFGFLTGGDFVAAVIWSTWTACLLLLPLAVQLSRQATGRSVAGFVAWLALVANPLLTSSAGLESHWLSVGILAMVQARLAGHERWLGVVAGLTVLVRPDAGVLFLLLIVGWPRRSQIRSGLPFALITAAWLFFSWRFLGSLVPDTLFIKKIQGDDWGTSLANGLSLFARTFPFEVYTSFLLLPAALALIGICKESLLALAVRLLAILALGHFVSYVLLGVAAYHWYYAPLVLVSAVLGGLGVDRLWASGQWARRLVALAFSMAPVLAMAGWMTVNGPLPDQMPIHTNFGTHGQYKAIGLKLAELDPDSGILQKIEIGTIGFYCRCPVYDLFSDRRLFGRYVREITSRYRISALFYRLNFYHFQADDDRVHYPPVRYQVLERRVGSGATAKEVMRFTVRSRWLPNGTDLALEKFGSHAGEGQN